MRLQGINPTKSIVYSTESRAEVCCMMLNINIIETGLLRKSIVVVVVVIVIVIIPKNYKKKNATIHSYNVCRSEWFRI